ncbi:MAG TPA: DUF3108 domain-containing protein [Caulobacterales bacterium]|nr:DUF3108 domain-containing protein [Caulobacterales bacterium]
MRKLAALLCLGLAALTGPAAAQDAEAATTGRHFEAVYSVRARGITAGDFNYSFRQNGAGYEASAERRITGLLRMTVGDSQDYSYSVRGQVRPDGALQPVTYRHQGGRRDRVVDVRFTANDIITTANPPMGMGHPPATQAQKAGAIDQLSAIASMVVATGDPCSRTLRVYMDGRARFDFVMSPNGRVNVNGPAFHGQALRCRVQFRPIAGFSDPQEASVLTFLFAPTTQGMYAPVRIEMPSDNGLVVLDARTLTVNGTRLR